VKFFSPTLLVATPSLRASSGCADSSRRTRTHFNAAFIFMERLRKQRSVAPQVTAASAKSKDVAELYDQVPLGAVVQIIPDRLPKMEKSKPRQEMSGGVVAAANVTPQPPPQMTVTKVANIPPEPPPQIAATKVAKVAPERPPRIAATKAANVTPEPPPQISATTLAMPPSTSLTVEQMRTAGALAGARRKAKLATNKRL